MKYYYNDVLVRTSKNHKYTHAVIKRVDGKVICVGCSSSKAGAESIKRKEAAYYETRVNNNEAALAALAAGKSGYYYKDGRKTGYFKFEKDTTKEYYEKALEDNKTTLARINSWEIVEVEER